VRSLVAASGDQSALAGAAEQLQLWEDLTAAQRKELLRQFVVRVTAHKDGEGVVCEVIWREGVDPSRPAGG
jgi:acyl-CoA reductase-like NAD-dependent aldehyde dehydrogenase